MAYLPHVIKPAKLVFVKREKVASLARHVKSPSSQNNRKRFRAGLHVVQMQCPLLLVPWRPGVGFPHHVCLCQLGIDQVVDMKELPSRVKELLTTPHREEIFNFIASQPDGFTLHGVHAALKNKKITASIASVQNM